MKNAVNQPNGVFTRQAYHRYGGYALGGGKGNDGIVGLQALMKRRKLHVLDVGWALLKLKFRIRGFQV